MRAALPLPILLAACAVTQSSPQPPDTLVPRAPTGDVPHAAPPARASCVVSPPRLQERTLASVIDLGDHAGKSWLIARRDAADKTARLVHLDRSGQLVETELPALTELAAFEPPARLHLLEYRQAPRWWSVELTDPDRPVAGVASAGPRIDWDGSSGVKAFAVSGNRAFVSVYRVKYSDTDTKRYGESAFYDRTTGERIGPLHPMTTWAAECAATRCAGIASFEGDDGELVVIEGDQVTRKPLGPFGCRGTARWRDGDRWLVALGGDSALRVVAVDLRRGSVREVSGDLTGDRCGGIHAVRLAGRAGVLVGGKTFIPIGSEPRIGAAERMPELSGRARDLAPLPDGAVLADFSADSWMKHGPTTADGKRYYHREWSFAGRAGLLQRRATGWSFDSASPLPESGTDGQFSRGYAIHALSNGHFGAVLMSGEHTRLVHLSRPCE